MRTLTAIALSLWQLLEPVSAEGEKPFPVGRTAILNARGTTYFVEGRQTIPPGCRISISRGVKIVGSGEEPTLVVEGTLLIHGTRNDNVFIRDLVIEPGTRFGEVRLDMVDFRGAGGVRNDRSKPVSGRIVIENAWMQLGAGIDVSMCSGQMLILNSSFGSPVRINGVTPKGKPRNSVKVSINGCGGSKGRGSNGFAAGLLVKGAYKVLIRNSRLGGNRAEFWSCSTLTFDGNKVDAEAMIVSQDSFTKAKLQKSDFYCDTLVLSAPPRAHKQRVLIDKCWFRDLTRPRDINEKIIHDGRDDHKCGVVAMFR